MSFTFHKFIIIHVANKVSFKEKWEGFFTMPVSSRPIILQYSDIGTQISVAILSSWEVYNYLILLEMKWKTPHTQAASTRSLPPCLHTQMLVCIYYHMWLAHCTCTYIQIREVEILKGSACANKHYVTSDETVLAKIGEPTCWQIHSRGPEVTAGSVTSP